MKINHIEHTLRRPCQQERVHRFTGRVRSRRFDLVADLDGRVLRIEWDTMPGPNMTPTWGREYINERDRLMRLLHEKIGASGVVVTAVKGVVAEVSTITVSSEGRRHV